MAKALSRPVAKDAARTVTTWLRATGGTPTLDGDDPTAIVDAIVEYALRRGASDIHLTPVSSGLAVGVRVGGTVETLEPSLPAAIGPELISALKRAAGIGAGVGPVSSGYASRMIGGESVVLNVSTFPTQRGESASVRLGVKPSLPSLDDLGLDPDLLDRARAALLARPHGVVLTTGPTGSGKSTTLYMFMAEVHRPGQRVMTIEDQVTFDLEDVIQVKTSEDFGVAAMLRAMAGADCDIALAHELRSSEELSAAFDLARLGVLMFSVMDAPDAPGALHRITQSGRVTPALVSSLLNLILAQALVAKSCAECRHWRRATPAEVEHLGLRVADFQVVTNAGCGACDGTGTRGRVLVVELVTMSPGLAAALERGADVQEIREALGPDFRSIDDDIRRRMADGDISVEVAIKAMGCRPELSGGLQAVASAAAKDDHLSDPLERLGGTVSIMFTDIVGSTRLTAELGDDAWMAVLSQHDALVRKQLDSWDGVAIKSVGDGFMAAFGSATAAVRCGLGIQESSAAMLLPDGSPLQLRAGIHAGEPVKDHGDLFGTTVNVAARVAAAAQPGEVLVSDLVRALVASTGRFNFGEARPVELRGLEGSHLLYPVA